MPLPAEVGQALADYLMRSRRADASDMRTVFAYYLSCRSAYDPEMEVGLGESSPFSP
jgi:hypothetical protein